ncbi:signal recognition particle protein [Eubacterium coprostanoligenes]|uniref:signal recognition particle protein n=1 Tax=Eubacterium coprostanoligenes TaxID=290054 RepID=UPI002352FDA3|nr:signal recognition particle protein [Eubacterium coprostanoligenes]MCI6355066.1 signal recognition particle protein [Eubacterium coprostanoligenes]MCI7265561.1 signal recognition particle protein [Eubacterium coprostanoligenes]
MAFEGLSERLENSFKKLRAKGKLTEADVKEAMREVRLALLEADVNYKVAKEFTNKVTERAIGDDVMENLTPGQMVIKIVNEELTELMGGTESRLSIAKHPPTVLMMCGLQGSGKTTHSGKLALKLKKDGHRPLLVACDVYRPAAIKQLQVVGSQIDVPVFEMGTINPVNIAEEAIKHAKDHGYDYVIIDTAGRLHIDEALMEELQNIRSTVHPNEILLVIDAMTGQDAVNVAKSFNESLGIDGVILTKLDGDTRGGAALSVRAVTGKPIKFVGTGEKLENLEVFHPARMASRILGMGDVLSFIEKAEMALDEKKAAELEKKLAKNKFDFNDLLDQFEQIERMGSLKDTIKMIPGIGKQIKDEDIDERAFDRLRCIIYSMTKQERANPEIINPSRKRRIAAGSGTSIEDVNKLMTQFKQMQKMVKQVGGRKGPKVSKKMRRLMQQNPEMAQKMMGQTGGNNNPFGF